MCTCTRSRSQIRTRTHTYTGWLESGIGLDARATRSIHHVASCALTPRNVGAPLPRRPCLSSFSLFLFLCRSLLYPPDYPSTTWPTCSPTPEKGTIRWKRAFGRPKTREGNTSLSRKFFDTHSDVNDVKKIWSIRQSEFSGREATIFREI